MNQMFCEAAPITELTRGPLQCTCYTKNGPPRLLATLQVRYDQAKTTTVAQMAATLQYHYVNIIIRSNEMP